MTLIWLRMWQTVWVKDGSIYTAFITHERDKNDTEHTIGQVHITQYIQSDTRSYTRRSCEPRTSDKFFYTDAERALFNVLGALCDEEGIDIMPDKKETFLHGFLIPVWTD